MADDLKCPRCGAALPAGVLEGLCPACLLRQGAADSATQPGAAPFQPPSVAEVSKLFPQLEVLALIGQGGMGAVYKARQPALDRFVALKILPSQAVVGPGFAERFNREARALARLNHPNIVAVYDFGQTGGQPYFIMEFVDGLNLRQLGQAGRLSPREALQIVPQICDALQYAHDEGVVHRDIKPENVLVDRKGRVKIADFGLAKILGRDGGVSRVTGEGQVLGTPHYMAPEQLERPLEVDHRADIYSLGVVFYEMLTGELPLGRFAPPSRKVVVDVRLDEVVLRALEKEPALRFQQASQVKTAVETIAGTTAPAAEARSEEQRKPEPPPQSVIPTWLGALWAPKFVLRDGQRVLNGPAVAYSFLALTGVLLVACLAAVLTTLVFARGAIRLDAVLDNVALAAALAAAAFTLFVGLYRGPRTPVQKLPNLDPKAALPQSKRNLGAWALALWLTGLVLPVILYRLVGVSFSSGVVFLAFQGAALAMGVAAWRHSWAARAAVLGVCASFVVARLSVPLYFLFEPQPDEVFVEVKPKGIFAASVAPKSAGTAAEAARLKFGAAEEQLKLVEARFRAGEVTAEEYDKAKFAHDAAAAELKGDAGEAARLELRLAEEKLKVVEARYQAGQATGIEYLEAKFARDTAVAKLKGDAPEVARLKLQFAEEKLKAVEAMCKAGLVSQEEYLEAKFARDVAATEYAREMRKATGK